MGQFWGLFSCDVNSSFLVSSALPPLTLICLWKSKSQWVLYLDWHVAKQIQHNWKQAPRVSSNHEKTIHQTLGPSLWLPPDGNGALRASQPYFHFHRQRPCDIWVTGGMISQLSFCLMATQNLLLHVTLPWSYSVPTQSQFDPSSKWKIKERWYPWNIKPKIIFIPHKWGCPITPSLIEPMGLTTSGKAEYPTRTKSLLSLECQTKFLKCTAR